MRRACSMAAGASSVALAALLLLVATGCVGASPTTPTDALPGESAAALSARCAQVSTDVLAAVTLFDVGAACGPGGPAAADCCAALARAFGAGADAGGCLCDAPFAQLAEQLGAAMGYWGAEGDFLSSTASACDASGASAVLGACTAPTGPAGDADGSARAAAPSPEGEAAAPPAAAPMSFGDWSLSQMDRRSRCEAHARDENAVIDLMIPLFDCTGADCCHYLSSVFAEGEEEPADPDFSSCVCVRSFYETMNSVANFLGLPPIEETIAECYEYFDAGAGAGGTFDVLAHGDPACDAMRCSCAPSTGGEPWTSSEVYVDTNGTASLVNSPESLLVLRAYSLCNGFADAMPPSDACCEVLSRIDADDGSACGGCLCDGAYVEYLAAFIENVHGTLTAGDAGSFFRIDEHLGAEYPAAALSTRAYISGCRARYFEGPDDGAARPESGCARLGLPRREPSPLETDMMAAYNFRYQAGGAGAGAGADPAAAGPLPAWDIGADPCSEWPGVTCSAAGDRIVGISVVGLPAFSGALVADLRALTALRTLHVAGTGLAGGVPEFLFEMPALEVLNLTGNALESAQLLPIEGLNSCSPGGTGDGSPLRTVDLSSNPNILGSLPVHLCAAHPNLEEIVLDHLGLEGFIPEECGHLARLRVLSARNNSLSGPATRWLAGGLAAPEALEVFHADGNALADTLDGLARLPSLRSLDLSDNLIAGRLPALPRSVAEVRLRNNRLSGDLYASLLSAFDLGAAGEADPFVRLGVLDLSRNALTGAVPDVELHASLPALAVLDLSFNALSGAVPRSLCAYTRPAHGAFALSLAGNFDLCGDPPACTGWPKDGALEASGWAFATQIGVQCGAAPAGAVSNADVADSAIEMVALGRSLRLSGSLESLIRLQVGGGTLAAAIDGAVRASQFLNASGTDGVVTVSSLHVGFEYPVAAGGDPERSTATYVKSLIADRLGVPPSRVSAGAPPGGGGALRVVVDAGQDERAAIALSLKLLGDSIAAAPAPPEDDPDAADLALEVASFAVGVTTDVYYNGTDGDTVGMDTGAARRALTDEAAAAIGRAVADASGFDAEGASTCTCCFAAPQRVEDAVLVQLPLVLSECFRSNPFMLAEEVTEPCCASFEEISRYHISEVLRGDGCLCDGAFYNQTLRVLDTFGIDAGHVEDIADACMASHAVSIPTVRANDTCASLGLPASALIETVILPQMAPIAMEERETMLEILSSLSLVDGAGFKTLNWDVNVPPCNWRGVGRFTPTPARFRLRGPSARARGERPPPWRRERPQTDSLLSVRARASTTAPIHMA